VHASCDNHIGLRTGDLEAAATFWQDALGGRLATAPVERGDAGVEAVFGEGAVIRVAQVTFDGVGGIELFEFLSPASPVPHTHQPSAAIMHFALTVDDIDEAAVRIEAAGGTVTNPPAAVAGAPDGPRFAYCATPEGHPFELVTITHAQVIEFVTELRARRSRAEARS
jgi:catechol 2,3-dioxygenase-like lactoylglutathione lyase family enzyme